MKPLVALPCALLLAVLALHFRDVLTECCRATKDYKPSFPPFPGGYTKCGDDTVPTPCCGYGPCNIFCCNCDGGCRGGGRFRRQAEDPFAKHDLNGDGFLSVHEAHHWFNSTGRVHNAPEEIRKLDKDEDGKLTRTEIGA